MNTCMYVCMYAYACVYVCTRMHVFLPVHRVVAALLERHSALWSSLSEIVAPSFITER